jgi:2-oxoisovalerate dehydrogenase E1 component
MPAHTVQKSRRQLLEDLLGVATLSSLPVHEDRAALRAKAKRVLETIWLTRFSDEKMGKLVRQNKGGTFHLGVAGHEMIGAISALSLSPGIDWAFPYYRDRAFAIGLGCLLEDLFAAFLAREIPHHSGGRMMPDHFSHKELRIPCQSSCVGSQFLQAAGVAKGVTLRGAREVVYVSGGEGATSQGDFHEMLNFSSLHCLPLVCVIQDNGWAISVPREEQTAGQTIAKMARGYEGLSVREVDGCDFLEAQGVLQEAVVRARQGEGPTLIVARVPRIAAHSSSDDPKKYKSDRIIAQEKERDPLPRFTEWLMREGWISREELDLLQEQCRERIEEAALKAEAIPFPARSSVLDHLFLPFEVEEREEVVEGGEPIVLMDALNHALIEEMERDPGVIVFGQDVARGKGGVFGITRHLTERFGAERCFNTPLAESTIVGLAIGLSLDGIHRPVAEIQFADYSWTGMNQLLNELASIHYRSNGEWHCPLVIRMPYGGYIQGGPYHSQSIEAFLAHCPGLKIAIPSHAADAKRLLKAAIRDPNPVVFLEHKALYRQRLFSARPEPTVDSLLPFGKAHIVREGSDITLVGWGMMVLMGVEVAERLAREGISVEVVDLRTLIPLDFATLKTSVQKTGKLLIIHEAPKTCGFGAELAARMAEEVFHWLDAPIQRLAGRDCPVSYCKELEDEVLPQKERIEEALRLLAIY